MPSTYRWPSALTPVAMTVATLIYPATLSHLVEQGVQPEVDVGPGIEGAVAELGHLDVEALGQLGVLGLGYPVDAHQPDQVIDPPGRHTLDVGLADHADQPLLGRSRGLSGDGR